MEHRIKYGGVRLRARIVDVIGRYLITIGGIGIIAAVLGILIFILREAYPLFESAYVEDSQFFPKTDTRLVGSDPHGEVAFLVTGEGVQFVSLITGEEIDQSVLGLPDGVFVEAISKARQSDLVVWARSDGYIQTGNVTFRPKYTDGQRLIVPKFEIHSPFQINREKDVFRSLSISDNGDGLLGVVAIMNSGRIIVTLSEEVNGMFSSGERNIQTYYLDTTKLKGSASSVEIDDRISRIVVGTNEGEIGIWSVSSSEANPILKGVYNISGSPVTSLSFFLGDMSLGIGFENGEISSWAEINRPATGSKLEKMHTLQIADDIAIKHLSPSRRDKQLLAANASGIATLHHLTSEQKFVSIDVGDSLKAISFSPKSDGFLCWLFDGRLIHYSVDNPHPEVNWDVLFDKIWYEGYQREEFVWQSTGGSDEFEPKLSLIPLIFGTAKGTIYAMLFALPLAVLAAIYTSEFATPRVRSIVKPSVEVMASLPSVILGFLAGLWLAPLLQSGLLGTFLLFPLVPIFVLLLVGIWKMLPGGMTRYWEPKVQLPLLIFTVCFSSWLAFELGPLFEYLVFQGDFLRWIEMDLGAEYDQRNSIIVGFAMGFAVVPLIFTICDDALSSVPRHLRAGSLALGSTPWQTAARVVLPMAMPGIFSAAMIGFGRAIGETMIVLMATGNTPVLDWSIFNGMRTISANIAVELPEAPHEGTLYRVLFLSGLLLFSITFVLNTLAEIIRQRLRDRYSKL